MNIEEKLALIYALKCQDTQTTANLLINLSKLIPGAEESIKASAERSTERFHEHLCEQQAELSQRKQQNQDRMKSELSVAQFLAELAAPKQD